jgi:GntR family transcriptional regulator
MPRRPDTPSLQKPISLPMLREISLADKATRALLRAIFQHQFPADRLPAEPQLAAQLGVSRTTVRAALQTIERLGILSRTPARGTKVRPHIGRESIVLHGLIGFREYLETSHKVRVQQMFRVVDRPTAEAMTVLDVAEDTPMVRSEKIVFADAEPAVFITDEIPLANFTPEFQEMLKTTPEPPVPDSIFALSLSWPGRAITHSVVDIEPIVIPDDRRFPLPIAPGTPSIALLQTHYSAANEAVARSTVHVDDRLIRFRVVRHAPGDLS